MLLRHAKHWSYRGALKIHQQKDSFWPNLRGLCCFRFVFQLKNASEVILPSTDCVVQSAVCSTPEVSCDNINQICILHFPAHISVFPCHLPTYTSCCCFVSCCKTVQRVNLPAHGKTGKKNCCGFEERCKVVFFIAPPELWSQTLQSIIYPRCFLCWWRFLLEEESGSTVHRSVTPGAAASQGHAAED